MSSSSSFFPVVVGAVFHLFAFVITQSDLTFQWISLTPSTGVERRVRIWGTLSSFTSPSGINYTYGTFLGLPFALPPINHLRFTRPTLRILDNDFRALTPPPPCPQLRIGDRGEEKFIGSEDCLQLNIYMPIISGNEDGSRSSSTPMPVLVWIHGDSPSRLRSSRLEPFTSGSSMDINPIPFIPGRVVIVVPQYRLGTLGFASTVNEDLTGNLGLFDQLLALDWVSRFIPSFNGDPKQVTLLGGSSAGLLATTELGQDLFQRLILMGGSPLSPLISVDHTPKVTYAEIALQNGCPSFPSSHFVRCMQGRRLSSIVEADGRLVKGRGGGLSKSRLPLPLVEKESDGRFLPPLLFRSAITTLKEGTFHKIPVIIGVTGQEMRGFLTGIAGAESPSDVKVLSSQDVLQNFLRSLLARGGGGDDAETAAQLVTFEYFAGLNLTERKEQGWDLLEETLGDMLFTIPALLIAQHWSKHAPVYFYLFDHGEPASHGSDLSFLMHGHSTQSAMDRELSSIMIQLWTSFIHQGSPLNAGVAWPEWRDESGRQFLLLSGEEVGIGHGLRERQFHLWNNLLPAMTTTAAKNKCPKSSSIVSRGKSLLFRDVDEGEAGKAFFTMDGNDDSFN